MTMEELAKYINDKIDDINNRFPNLISSEQKDNYIKSNTNLEMSPEEIETKIKEIDDLYENIIKQQERIIELRKELARELQKKKEELKDVNKTFGEVYKSYVIHTLKLYEDVVNDESITLEAKKQVFESRLSEYLASENIRMNEYALQQITDPERIKLAQSEMFLGKESLNFESVANLYKTFVEDLNLIANDSEGKMYSTVMNNKGIEFDSQGNLITEIDYNFSGIKEIYDFAKEHGKEIKYHTFLWHNAIPENLKKTIDSVSNSTLKRNMALSFLRDYASHLSNFISENGYDLKQIEVLNEIASDQPDNNILRDSWWKDVIGKNPLNGDEYFIDVLRIVREQFPNVELTYNDYNEYLPYKCDKMCAIVKYIQEIEARDNQNRDDKVTLLDGLGVQAHYTDFIKTMNTPLTIDMIEQSSLKFMKLGIPIFVSEFDYNTIANKDNPAKDQELKQAFIKYYAGIANGFNMWGNSDNLTWRYTVDKATGEFRNSHMIDANGRPKEIYQQVIQQMGIITKTKELDSLLSDIEQTSLLSNQEVANKYMQTPQGMQYVEQIKVLRQQQIAQIQEQRRNNPDLSDADFYKKMMTQFLTPVVQQISEEYKGELPLDKMQKVLGLSNPDNIIFSLDKGINDIQADSQTGKIIINPEKTMGSTIEEKIVTSMGTSIHETFHLMINMLKTPEQAEKLGERLMYKVSTSDGEKEVHFAPGKYGQVLSEGFVEMTSSEFAQRNGSYSTINPSYIPYVNLCSYIQKQSKDIDNKFLFTKNADDVVAKMTPSAKTSVESTERLAVFNNFEVKEIKKDESLKGIKSDSVVSSWMEKNDKKVSEKKNDNFQKIFTPQVKKTQNEINQSQQKVQNSPIKSESFAQRSQSEIQVHNQIKEKNQAIKQQKEQQRQINKPKVKTLTQASNNSGSSNSKGFTNVIILSLIVSFVCGALFMIVYMFIEG